MSFNRENIVWQSKDKTWNIGFYTCIPQNNWNDPDYDEEWDVDYDTDSFEWVSTGHSSAQAAFDSWRGVNPGSSVQMGYTARNAKEIAEFDRMAVYYKHPEIAAADKKKKTAKLNKTHRDALKVQLNGSTWVGKRATIALKYDDDVYSPFGMTTTYAGYVQVDADGWWTVDGQRFFNPVTNRVVKKLRSVEGSSSSSRTVWR